MLQRFCNAQGWKEWEWEKESCKWKEWVKELTYYKEWIVIKQMWEGLLQFFIAAFYPD